MNGSVIEEADQPPPGLNMPGIAPAPPFAQAVAELRRLAVFHAEDPTVAFLNGLRRSPLRGAFSLALDRDDAFQAIALIDEVVSDLPAPITDDSIAPLRADFAAIHHDRNYLANPTESGWAAAEAQPSDSPSSNPPSPGDLTATLQRWHRHAGLDPNGAGPPDHLVAQLTLLAALLESGQTSDATLFLDQHPLRWIPAFCRRVATRCQEPFYAGVAILTAAHLDHLRDRLASACDMPRPRDDAAGDARRRHWADGRLPRTCLCDT